MNSLRQSLRLGQQVGLRKIYTTPRTLSTIDPESTDVYKKLKANQERFQKDDLIEDVYIKGGIIDVFGFRLLSLLTFVGIVWDFKVIGDFALM